MTVELTVDELLASAGRDLGSSGWMTITQERIDAFAEATGDRQWIHSDPDRAAAGPYGATIAHGYLTLSLLPVLLRQLYVISDGAWGLNYGIEKLRFLAPVPAGAEIRLSAWILDAQSRDDGGCRYRIGVKVEIRGGERPAMVGEILFLRYRAAP